MVEKSEDYYCPPAKEMDLTILVEKLWWDIIHSESQIPSELTEEWYLEFQDGYEILIEREAPTSWVYQQRSQSSVESENENEESKWDLKMDDYDKESREYY